MFQKNKKISAAFLAVGIILVIFSTFNKKKPTKQKKQIAILYPVAHDSLDLIIKGFKEELSKKLDAEYTLYNANGDKMLLNSQVNDILLNDYDLVCAIATSPLVMLTEQANQKGSHIPIIACAGDINQVNKNIDPRNYVGVTICDDNKSKIDAIVSIYKPERIIIPHASVPMLEEEVNEIIKLAEAYNVEVVPVIMNNIQDIGLKLEHYFSDKKELVLILQDNFIVSNLEIVLSKCKQYKKICFTSDLESVEHGSVLGLGVLHYECGKVASEKAFDILILNKKASELEHSNIDDYKIKINMDNPMAKELNYEILKTKYKDRLI